MLYDDPEPNILELQKLVESLCKHLRDAKPGISDPTMSTELSNYVKTLEDANKDLVTEYAQAKNEYEAALQKMKEDAPIPEEPKAPPEEEVLPIGLAVRNQLLKRFGVPKAAAKDTEVASDVWQLTSSEFPAAEKDNKPGESTEHKKPKTMQAAPPKEPDKHPKPSGEDAWDITSGEWRSQD